MTASEPDSTGARINNRIRTLRLIDSTHPSRPPCHDPRGPTPYRRPFPPDSADKITNVACGQAWSSATGWERIQSPGTV
jgi:hypothetical protein